MISSDETITKFCTCFGYSKHDFERRLKPEESVYLEMGMNVSAFKKMLIKNDMEDYTNELLYYWYIQLLNAKHKTISKIQTSSEVMKNRNEHEKDLTEMLIFLLTDSDEADTSITFQRSRNSLTKVNKAILKSVIGCLLDEYDKNNFNEEELTFEEAAEEINNKCDESWIKDYMKVIISGNPSLFSFDLDDYKYGDFFDEAFEICYDDQMVEIYANEHYTKHEITLEYLNYKLTDVRRKTKKKVGAKPKNEHIAIIGSNLSYLKRIDRFIENSENLKDINLIKLTNKDYRFIHDFLVFLNLIEDYSIKENTTTTPEKYIHTTLSQNKSLGMIKNRSSKYMYESISHLMKIEEINKLKTNQPQ
jgi:hypothetical protein